MQGLRFSRFAPSACTPVQRPPLYRYSSVLMTNEVRTSFARRRMVSAISAAGSPWSRSSQASSTKMPMPAETLRESTG